ncbi:ROK family protein, partial [Nocardia alni]|uniref:ROK family protein n=1 Tax=Nocardia alni TaxID=2815723 RepID=UPI0027DF3445
MTGRPMATPGVSAGDVLCLIRGHDVITRADIRRLTGLSRTAVTLRVDQLLERGLIAERAEGGSTGGRPPTRLVFNPESGVVLAASIGASRAQVAVCDLGGRILAAAEFAVHAGGVTQEVLARAAEHMEVLLTRVGGAVAAPAVGVNVADPRESTADISAGSVPGTRVSGGGDAGDDAQPRSGGSQAVRMSAVSVEGDDPASADTPATGGRIRHGNGTSAGRVVFGVGVSVPAAVDVATGLSMGAGPALGDVAVSEYFTERFAAPVRVDSDVNALALAEHARHPEIGDLLLVKASTGIGAGIIAGG